eukprot:8817724-Alexandrium_andersonii.AAC.1
MAPQPRPTLHPQGRHRWLGPARLAGQWQPRGRGQANRPSPVQAGRRLAPGPRVARPQVARHAGADGGVARPVPRRRLTSPAGG